MRKSESEIFRANLKEKNREHLKSQEEIDRKVQEIQVLERKMDELRRVMLEMETAHQIGISKQIEVEHRKEIKKMKEERKEKALNEIEKMENFKLPDGGDGAEVYNHPHRKKFRQTKIFQEF